jgi:hypothetical protein
MAWDLISQQREHFLQELNDEGYAPSQHGANRNRYTLMHWASLTCRKKTQASLSQPHHAFLKASLTVLIPTLPEREKIRTPLLEELTRQGVPFLTADRIGISTGQKRNVLLDMVSTPYFAFIDDDDWISRDYGSVLARYLVRFSPQIDVLAFSVLYLQNQHPAQTILMGASHSNWHLRGPVLRRPVLPWCVMKTDFAQALTFPDLYWGEDRIWSEQIHQQQPEMIHIPNHLYCYEFLKDDSKTNQEKHIQAFYNYLKNR